MLKTVKKKKSTHTTIQYCIIHYAGTMYYFKINNIPYRVSSFFFLFLYIYIFGVDSYGRVGGAQDRRRKIQQWTTPTCCVKQHFVRQGSYYSRAFFIAQYTVHINDISIRLFFSIFSLRTQRDGSQKKISPASRPSHF